MSFPRMIIELPAWLTATLGGETPRLETAQARMDFVIGLARRNVEEGGGPFAAAVFESESGALVAPGVNRVVPSGVSILHAEIVALSLAQRALGHYNLGADSVARELVTSTEPCAMCLGAVPWSGIRRLVCAARGADAEAIGFDEGAKPDRWPEALGKRGIEVIRDLRRPAARKVLEQYRASGGVIY